MLSKHGGKISLSLFLWPSHLSAVRSVIPGLTAMKVSTQPIGVAFLHYPVFLFNLCTLLTVGLNSFLMAFTIIRLEAIVGNRGLCAGRTSTHHSHYSGNCGSQVSFHSTCVHVQSCSALQLQLWLFQIKEAPQGRPRRRHGEAIHQPLFTTG